MSTRKRKTKALQGCRPHDGLRNKQTVAQASCWCRDCATKITPSIQNADDETGRMQQRHSPDGFAMYRAERTKKKCYEIWVRPISPAGFHSQTRCFIPLTKKEKQKKMRSATRWITPVLCLVLASASNEKPALQGRCTMVGQYLLLYSNRRTPRNST